MRGSGGRIALGGRLAAGADLANGTHGIEHARDDLRRSRSVHLVGSFRFDELSVGEDDAELVVQLVEQPAGV